MSQTLIEQFFPFYRLGLSRNPFGTLSVDEWYAVTILPLPVQAALDDGFDHLLVLGRKGRGKSTTLNYLRYHFMLQKQTVAYERLPRWHWRYTTNTAPLDVFALDEMQRLAPWEIERLFVERKRHHLRLIVGSHRDHTFEFRMHRLQVVTVRLGQQMTEAQLAAILQRRLDVFATDDGAKVWVTPEAVAWLWGRYHTNLRAINHHLYNVFQQIKSPGAVTLANVKNI